jgi:(2S)-methylsuccinyl-CoA dehydrogenase
MAHDGQDLEMTKTIILPDLMALTAASIAPVETVLETAKT